MALSLRYCGRACDSIDDLIDKLPRDAVGSPRRSTIPLIQYWRHADAALDALWSALGVPKPSGVELAFEYPTPVRDGRGKPSFTDLMVISEAAAVAIEAKYTEPEYQSVETWLGREPTENRNPGHGSGNRSKVLRGWLEAIGSVTGQTPSGEELQKLPYQVIHRTASVCCIDRPLRAVVYQVFHRPAPDHYLKALKNMATLIGPSSNVSLWMHECEATPSRRSAELLARWDAGEREVAEDVRALLGDPDSLRVHSMGYRRVT